MATHFLLTSQAGQTFVVGERGLTIGRHKANDIVVPDRRVSRLHARIDIWGGICWVRDENSLSGVFVNGRRVQTQQVLQEGDILQIGPASFRLSMDRGPARVKSMAYDHYNPYSKRYQRPGMFFLASVILIGVVILLSILQGKNTISDSLSNEGVAPDLQATSPGREAYRRFTLAPGENIKIELYNGAKITLYFQREDGEPIGISEGVYISDESGFTIIAFPDSDRHYPVIRFFPSEAANRSVFKRAAPQQQTRPHYTIVFRGIRFRNEVYFETTYLNLDHLKKLPINMPQWEERMTSREDLCNAAATSVSAFHTTVAIIHGVAHPPTGVPHTVWAIGKAVVIHASINMVCNSLLVHDPVSEYIDLVNRDLSYHIFLQGKQTAAPQGYIIGQVIDSETSDGIPGASISVGLTNATTFSNGWYYLHVPWGETSITASATGYDSVTREIDLSNMAPGTARLIDPLPLKPSPQTQTLGRGDVIVTLRWFTEDDLDLHVRDPEGFDIYYKEPRSPSGGQLDVDSNPACRDTTTTPVENIFWPVGEAPSGLYRVSVVFYATCASPGSVDYEVTINIDGDSISYRGTISRVGEEAQVTSFSH